MERRQAAKRKATGCRIEKACNSCRHRKERCDGGQPRCGPCAASGRQCLYTTPSKKRGLREGWVHSLEKLLALAIECCPEVEPAVTAALTAGLRCPQGNGFAARWSDESHGRGLLKSWRESHLAKHLDSVHSDLERLPRLRLPISPTRDQVSSSDPNLAKPGQPPSVPSTLLSDATVRDAADNQDNPPAAAEPAATTASTEHSRTNQSLFPRDSPDLIERFFKHTHSWLPILEKHEIYHTYYRILEEPGLVANDIAAAPVLAVLHHSQSHESCAGQRLTFATAETNSSTPLMRACIDLISSEERGISINHAQALLVLALVAVRDNRLVTASMQLARASRIALLLRRDNVSRSKPTQDGNERLSHVQRACYCLDGMLSACMKLPAPVYTLIAAEIPDVSIDGLEEWAPHPVFCQPAAATVHAGPLLSLSTFNDFGHAVQDLVFALRSSLPPTYRSESPSEPVSISIQDSPLNLSQLPHELTVQLTRLTTTLLLENDPQPQGPNRNARIEDWKRWVHEFCYTFKDRLKSFKRASVCPAWTILLTIIFRRVSNDPGSDLEHLGNPASETLLALHKVAATLYDVDPSPFHDSLLTQIQTCFSNGPITHAPVVDIRSLQIPERTEDSERPLQPACDAPGDQQSTSIEGNPATQVPFTVGATDGMSDISSTAFEFMAMDAMQWTDTSNESLLHLGFVDPDDRTGLNFFLGQSDHSNVDLDGR